jgi:hypothetical protein
VPLPSAIIQCYHAIACAGESLLTADGRDWFPEGREPRVRRVPAVDTPDCAGRAAGEIFNRGNVRWEASISRVRCFLDYTYPVTDGDITAASPEEYAQKWLVRHLTAFSTGSTSLAWTGRRTWASASVAADGTTDGGWAVVDYSVQMSDASSS